MNDSGNNYRNNYSSREGRPGRGSSSSVTGEETALMVNGGAGDVDGGLGRQPTITATATTAMPVKGPTRRRDNHGIGGVPPSADNGSRKKEVVVEEVIVVGSKLSEPPASEGGQGLWRESEALPSDVSVGDGPSAGGVLAIGATPLLSRSSNCRDGVGSDASGVEDDFATAEIRVAAVREAARLVVITGAASETIASSSNNGGNELYVSAAHCSDKLSSAKEGVHHRCSPSGGFPSKEGKATLLLDVADENTTATTTVSVAYEGRGIKRPVIETRGSEASSSSSSCSEKRDHEKIVDGAAGRESPPILERKTRATSVNGEDNAQHQPGADSTADTRSSHESGRLDIMIGEMMEPQDRYPSSRRGTGDADGRPSLSFVKDDYSRESSSSDEIDRPVAAQHLGDLQQQRKPTHQQGKTNRRKLPRASIFTTSS